MLDKRGGSKRGGKRGGKRGSAKRGLGWMGPLGGRSSLAVIHDCR
jgi:hypothetical protein